jgi:LmbE family N-acetylglucosaminyl deacetylase
MKWTRKDEAAHVPGQRLRAHGHTLPAPRWHSGYAGEVCCYEVWTSLWPNVGVDISSAIDTKREAVDCYASQVAHLHYVEGTLGLNRFRGA